MKISDLICRCLAAGLLMSCSLCAVPSRAVAADRIVVREAYESVNAVQWPDLISAELGFGEREGLSVETVMTQVDSMIGALMGGSVEIGLTGSTALALAVDKGAPIVGVGIAGNNVPYHFMTAPAVKSFKDLKGKTIALFDPTDIYTTVVRTILKKNGINPDTDVQILYGSGSSQRYAAILGGAIQGGLFLLPQDADLVSRGYNALAFTPDYYPNLTLSVLAVNRAWAAKNGDVLRRFLRARSNAIKWLNDPANKDRAIRILMAGTKLAIGPATATYDYYVMKTHSFPNDGCIERKGLDGVVGDLSAQGRLTNLHANDAGKIMDRQWCPR